MLSTHANSENQPNGAVVVLHAPRGTVAHASANAVSRNSSIQSVGSVIGGPGTSGGMQPCGFPRRRRLKAKRRRLSKEASFLE